METKIRHTTAWSESNGFWYLMQKNNEIIRVESNLRELAFAQGAKAIKDDVIEISVDEAIALGLYSEEEAFEQFVGENWVDFADEMDEKYEWLAHGDDESQEYFRVINPALIASDIVIETDDDLADTLDAVRVQILRDECFKFFAERWDK